MTRVSALTTFMLAMSLALPLAAAAQQRPLVTEDPETIGAGRILIETGIDYARDVEFPVSGLKGHLRRFPLIGVSLGIGSVGEVQIDGGLYNHLMITERRTAPLSFMFTKPGSSTSDVEDLVVGTKVRLVSEGESRPSIGMRTATKIPMASNEGGIGLDTFELYSTLLMAKTVQSVRVVGNIGLGILADPTRGDSQNDVLLYGISFARAVTARAEVVGEINGRKDTRAGDPPPGTESRSTVRFGARYLIDNWRADAAMTFGVNANDPSIGFGAGFIYVFTAFQTP
ncbi:MAG: hypothetical protein EXQ59_05695 [Acidobacteria bacterium]|nr:hypothetical protein [Acidobacteriota bacterium]